MAFMSILIGLGLLFYILLGFRALPETSAKLLYYGVLGFWAFQGTDPRLGLGGFRV